MPKPVSISLSPKPDDLASNPELVSHIARIALAWSNIEEELALIFAYGMGAEPAISAAIMGNVANLATRLAMIRTALTLGVSEEAGSAFWKMFEQKIRKRAKSRNIVVHAIWTVHADYPNELIRTSGIMDPFLNAERYSLADFLGIELELAKLREGLRVFDMLLPSQFPHRDQTERPPFWRRSEPQQPEADAQGQSDQTHPSE